MSEDIQSTAEPSVSDLLAQIQALQARLTATEQGNVAQFTGEVPRYRLNAPCYLEDDTLHLGGEEIEYLNTPNLEMVPLNGAARARLQSLMNDMTEEARRVAESNGRPFMGLMTDKGQMIAQAFQDARRTAQQVAVVSMPEERGIVPVMPHTDEAKALQKRRGRPPKANAVVSAKAPPLPGKQQAQPMAILGSQDGARSVVG